MPVMDGIEATRQVTRLPATAAPRVLVLTTFDLDDYVYEALRAGASGFLLKDAPADDLVARGAGRGRGRGAARTGRHPAGDRGVRLAADPVDAARPARSRR